MEFDQNVQYLSYAFWQIIMTAGPVLGIALAIGLFIGLIQAATSIQEMTLSFIPKLIVLVVTLFFFGGWQILTLMEYFQSLLENLPIYLQ